jgi:hypothetical protein
VNLMEAITDFCLIFFLLMVSLKKSSNSMQIQYSTSTLVMTTIKCVIKYNGTKNSDCMFVNNSNKTKLHTISQLSNWDLGKLLWSPAVFQISMCFTSDRATANKTTTKPTIFLCARNQNTEYSLCSVSFSGCLHHLHAHTYPILSSTNSQGHFCTQRPLDSEYRGSPCTLPVNFSIFVSPSYTADS